MPHESLQVLPRFELRVARHVARDDGRLVEMAHLHRHGKALQNATSAITDNGSHLPSDRLQYLNAVLVRTNGFVGEELPGEICMTARTAPHHDAEESLEVRGIHDDDHLIGCQILSFNLYSFQVSLYPLRAASVLLGDLCMGLFTVRELSPDFFLFRWLLLTELFPAILTSPELSTVVCAILLDAARSAIRTYFSWYMGKNLSISPLLEETKSEFQPRKLSTSPVFRMAYFV